MGWEAERADLASRPIAGKRSLGLRCEALAQNEEGCLRQREEAILGAFPAVDVQHHTLAINIPHLQMLGFLQAQTPQA